MAEYLDAEDDVDTLSSHPSELKANDTFDVPTIWLNRTSNPLYLDQSPILVSLNGYSSPFLILVTMVTNTLVCLVLLQRKMRTPTNVLLVAIATSDMLTGVWPLPCFLHFFVLGNYRDWVEYDWCVAYFYLTEYLPTVFHTSSIWLTVVLAAQRYVCVCRAQTARVVCTVPNFVRVIVGVYLAALVSQASRFGERRFAPVEVTSLVDPRQTITGCVIHLAPFVQVNPNVYYNVYYWFRVVFIHLVPCTSLVVLNGLLVGAMRTARRRRDQLLTQNRRPGSSRRRGRGKKRSRLADGNCTTLMLVHVVGLFLLVEFPLAVLFIILIVQNSFDLALISESGGQIATAVINLCILVSYGVNFFIYCSMSRQFRLTFKETFCFTHKNSKYADQTRYVSMTTIRNNRTVTQL